ncbi:MAG: hypothetical protein PHS73_01685 [Candidatus Peribacteraceae bacterium]|nr:hypothetical protein [Candidatus Peribacteraceae bacterium]
MDRMPSHELEPDEYVRIDGDQCIGSGLAAPCTIVLAQGTEPRPALMGHFLHLANADGLVNLRLLAMLREAEREFGATLRIKIRGNSFFPHQGEHLRPIQVRERKIFTGLLDSMGIPSDIRWAQDNEITSMTFDARTGRDTVEVHAYVLYHGRGTVKRK